MPPTKKDGKDPAGARPGRPAATEQEQIGETIDALDEDLAALRVRYDQFFLGLERRNPVADYDGLKRRILKLKTASVRNTALKFRVHTISNKFLSYERLWLKTLKEMEEGTYKRDLLRIDRKKSKPKEKEPKEKEKSKEKNKKAPSDAEAAPLPQVPSPGARKEEKPVPSPVTPPPSASKLFRDDLEADLPDELFEDRPAPKPSAPPGAVTRAPAAPQPRAPPPPPPPSVAKVESAVPPPPRASPPPPPHAEKSSTGLPMSDDRLKQLYDAYLTAKRRCRESTDGITLDAVTQTLRSQVPKLMQEHGVTGVDFKVVIKEGKAVLKAVPK